MHQHFLTRYSITESKKTRSSTFLCDADEAHGDGVGIENGHGTGMESHGDRVGMGTISKNRATL